MKDLIEDTMYQHNEVSAFAEDWWDSPYTVIEDGEDWKMTEDGSYVSKMVVYHREKEAHLQITRVRTEGDYLIQPVTAEDVIFVEPVEMSVIRYMPITSEEGQK